MIDVAALIVSALVRALLVGVQKAAQSAASEGFAALRNLLIERYGKPVADSLARLEVDPQSIERQNLAIQRLQEAGVDTDPEVAHLAKVLLELLENSPDRSQSSESPDPVADLQRTAGREAVEKVLQEHIRRLQELRERRNIEDVDLLTGRIRLNPSLPDDIKQRADTLHSKIREIVRQVATSIETARYREAEAAVSQLPTGLAERERAAALVKADKHIHVAYETLRLTVEFFSDLNDAVLKGVDDETLAAPQRANMMFGNAIMIYELTDLVIGYVQDFTLGNEHSKLYSDSKQRVQALRERQDELKRKALNANIEEPVRERTLESIAARETAFDALDAEWDRYLHDIQELGATVAQVQGRIPTLELIKEDAEIQIMTLQVAAMLRFLRQNSESLQGAVRTLQGFRLAPLNSTRLRQLLGV